MTPTSLGIVESRKYRKVHLSRISSGRKQQRKVETVESQKRGKYKAWKCRPAMASAKRTTAAEDDTDRITTSLTFTAVRHFDFDAVSQI